MLVNEAQRPETQQSELQAAIAKAQGIVRQHVPEGQSLSEELIQERRAESARE